MKKLNAYEIVFGLKTMNFNPAKKMSSTVIIR